MKRTRQTTIAAILQFLLSAYAVVASIPILAQVATDDAPPFVVMVLGFSMSVLGLVSAYGLWKNQRWGKILTIVLRAIDGLLALPGIFFARTPSWWSAALTTVVLSVVLIVLLLWPAPKAGDDVMPKVSRVTETRET